MMSESLLKIIQGHKVSIVSMMWNKNIKDKNELLNKTNQNVEDYFKDI